MRHPVRGWSYYWTRLVLPFSAGLFTTRWRATTFRSSGCFWITAQIRLWPPTPDTRQSNWPTAPAWRPSSQVGVPPSAQSKRLQQPSFEWGCRLVFASAAHALIIIAFDAVNKGWNLPWCGAVLELFSDQVSTCRKNSPCHPAVIEENQTIHSSKYHLNFIPFRRLQTWLTWREAALLPNSLEKWLITGVAS